MKTMLAALLLLPSLAFSQSTGGLPQAASMVPTAAPQNRADGAIGAQIADREGNTKAALGHAEYTEPARRGKTFTTAVAAYTIIADNARALTFGGAITWPKPIVGFYNPTGSGVNAVLMTADEWNTSGTSAGPWFVDFLCGQNWVSASSGTIYNDLLTGVAGGGSQMIPQNGQNPSTSPASTSTMLDIDVLGGPDTTALSSGGEAGHSKDLKGRIVVPPGCLVGLFAYGTGTSNVVNASLSWEEVAQ